MDWTMKIILLITLTGLFKQYFGQETTEQGTTTETIEDESLVRSLNNFGFKLLVEMMNEKENSNVVISPAGITGLMAMTLLGSAGRTYDEIAKVLGFSQDIVKNRKHHEQLGELLQYLNQNGTSKTTYADAIFIDESTRLREVYRSYLTMVYSGDALMTNFVDSVKAREVINEWVKSHTAGKIEDFLKETLPESTKVVLLSALYFKGQWAQPFFPEHTRRMKFTTPTNEIMANLMANFGNFDYIFSVDDELHMAAFPYNDSATTLYALKPRFPKRLSLPELMNRINYAKIDDLINKMKKKKCVIRFPKMEIRSTINLKEPLQALGVKSMFLPSEANFALLVDGSKTENKTEVEIISRINSETEEYESRQLRNLVDNLVNPGLFVDSVLHEVKMNIDEYGTEAVAATSAVMARTAESFYADSPFYMFIRNEKTKLVTFSAVIFDPTV